MDNKTKELIDRLEKEHSLSTDEYAALLDGNTAEARAYIAQKADEIRRNYYGTDIFVRGLIEFTNYCRNNCYYCGIRCGNNKCERYRLTEEEILECAEEGYSLGFHTFVLQGGEDPFFTDEKICDIVRKIKQKYPDCAITLSIGEKEKESYRAFKEAGADRYLLRHETANKEHYERLHPAGMSYEHRMNCLKELREAGFAVGAGFMVGSPYQTNENLANDLKFIETFRPEMCGIGPFIPHAETPFAQEKAGTLEQTLYLLSIIRLICPSILLPSTTALGTIHPQGRELGVNAGANVVMPNLSPTSVRKKYLLYDNKICTGDEAAECRHCLEMRMKSIGYRVVTSRGDYKPE